MLKTTPFLQLPYTAGMHVQSSIAVSFEPLAKRLGMHMGRGRAVFTTCLGQAKAPKREAKARAPFNILCLPTTHTHLPPVTPFVTLEGIPPQFGISSGNTTLSLYGKYTGFHVLHILTVQG